MQLDHAIIGVADLDAAVDTYERILGRPVAVQSGHPAFGTRNALFLFDTGPYLELLALEPGAPAGGPADTLRRFLAEHGEGLFGLALAPEDLDAAIGRLRRRGITVPDATHGTGAGVNGRVREWRAAPLPADAMHGALAFLVEHLGWDWRADLRTAPPPDRAGSAATGIHHIVFDVPDADATSALWEEALNLPIGDRIRTERMGALVNVHPAGAATLEAVSATTPDGPVAERIRRRGHGLSSIAFAVDDLDAAVRAVRAAGIVAGDPASGVLPDSRVARIEPASARGVAAQMLQFG